MVRRDTGLVWGLKDRFLDYVERWPGSTVDLAPGSGRLPDGRFYFAPDPQRPAGAWWFRGGLRIRAHEGLLDVTVADPRVEARGSAHVLTADTWNEDRWERLVFADLACARTAEDGILVVTATASLHHEATGVFDGTYVAGEDLAPVHLRLERSG